MSNMALYWRHGLARYSSMSSFPRKLPFPWPGNPPASSVPRARPLGTGPAARRRRSPAAAAAPPPRPRASSTPSRTRSQGLERARLSEAVVTTTAAAAAAAAGDPHPEAHSGSGGPARGAQDGPRGPRDRPKTGPRGRTGGPKRPTGGSREAPEKPPGPPLPELRGVASLFDEVETIKFRLSVLGRRNYPCSIDDAELLSMREEAFLWVKEACGLDPENSRAAVGFVGPNKGTGILIQPGE